MSWSKRDWFFCLILAVVTMLAYQPAWHGGLLWDDDANIAQSGVAFPGWFEANLVPARATQQYYPLLYTSSGFSKGCGAIRPPAIIWSIFFCTSAVSCWC